MAPPTITKPEDLLRAMGDLEPWELPSKTMLPPLRALSGPAVAIRLLGDMLESISLFLPIVL